MKRQLLTALFLTAATVVIAPIANAAEVKPSDLQALRYEVLDRGGSKSVEDIQATRLAFLENQSKAIENLQEARLEHLDSQTKAVDNLQEARLNGLDARSKTSDR